jgi:hypothetical protein
MIFGTSNRPNGYANTSTSGTAAGTGKLKHVTKNLLYIDSLSYKISLSSELPAEYSNLKYIKQC